MTRGQMAFLVHKLILDKEGRVAFTNVRNVRSPGCDVAKPAVAPTQSVVNGLTRNYITAIGNNYSQNKPASLIFAFHGRTNPNTQVRTYYGIEKASQGNAIVIYPL